MSIQGYHLITSTNATKVEKKDAFLKYWNRADVWRLKTGLDFVLLPSSQLS